MEVAQRAVLRLREAEERLDFARYAADCLSDVAYRRGDAGNDAINNILAPLDSLRRKSLYPVNSSLKSLNDCIPDFPDG